MISINNIGKSYGGQWAVDIAQQQIETGEIVGLVGNNGAGKTTLFRLILDLVSCLFRRRLFNQLPDTGRVFLFCRETEQLIEGGGG